MGNGHPWRRVLLRRNAPQTVTHRPQAPGGVLARSVRGAAPLTYGVTSRAATQVAAKLSDSIRVPSKNRNGAMVGAELPASLPGCGSPVQLPGELLEDERGYLCRRAVVCVNDEVVRRELMEFSR